MQQYTLSELRAKAEKYNKMPWTFPTESQKDWLLGFLELLEMEEKAKRENV